MCVMLVCTVGNRDVITLESIPLDGARAIGREILDNYDSYKEKLEFPIIAPTIKCVLRRESKINRLVLVATDQENEDETFRKRDTIHFAEILKKWLTKEYVEVDKSKKKIFDIRIVFITRENPTLLDEMYKFFGYKLKSKDFQIDDLSSYYIQTTGGIPAANTALLLRSVDIFGTRCKCIYVSEKTKEAEILNIGDQLIRESRRRLILDHLSRYDYAAVSGLLRLNENKPYLHELSEYAKHRLYFDMDTAIRRIEDAYTQADTSTRFICEALKADVRKLEEKNLRYLIRELLFNSEIKYFREEYVDFVGRIFRFQECVLRFIVEEELKVDTEKDNKVGYRRFIEGIESRPELRQYIESQTYSGNPIKYDEARTPVLMTILRFLIEVGTSLTSEQKEKYKRIYELLEQISKLSSLRNKSIIAHGFAGISKEILEREYGSPNIHDDLREIASRLNIPLEYNAYKIINEHLHQNL